MQWLNFHLCIENVRCVAPDLRGYNETSKPSGIENYSIDVIVDDIKALIEGKIDWEIVIRNFSSYLKVRISLNLINISLVDPGLGRDRCILVGHDWGGAIGYHFCGKYPDMVSEVQDDFFQTKNSFSFVWPLIKNFQYIVCNLPHPSSMKEQLRGLDQILKSWYIMFFQCPLIPEMYFR
jgi:hypothetical protein